MPNPGEVTIAGFREADGKALHLLANAAEALLQVNEFIRGLLQVLEGLLHALDGVVHGDGKRRDMQQPLQALRGRQGCLCRQQQQMFTPSIT